MRYGLKYITILFFFILKIPLTLGQCGLDIFVANDMSGSVDAREEQQSRNFIRQLSDVMAPLGTAAHQSRIAIAEWSGHSSASDSSDIFSQFTFPVAGKSYTTEASDLMQYIYAVRKLNGGTDVDYALRRSYQFMLRSDIQRNTKKVLILMTDASCDQLQNNIFHTAEKLKASGIYLVVLAIDNAAACQSIQGEKLASPGGYFSASSYQELEEHAIQLLYSIRENACKGGRPGFDLQIKIDRFAKEDCNINNGKQKIYATVTNVGEQAFNGRLNISFYDKTPFSGEASLLTLFAGNVSIGIGKSYKVPAVSYTGRELDEVYAIVNFDGQQPENKTPVPLYYKELLYDSNETRIHNNISRGERILSASCPETGNVNTSVQLIDRNCEEVMYRVDLCNDGTVPVMIHELNHLTDEHFKLIYADDLFEKAEKSYGLDWSTTYYSSSNVVRVSDLAVNASRNEIIQVGYVGFQNGDNLLRTPGTHVQAVKGGDEAFVARFDEQGKRLSGHYYGGSGHDRPAGIVVEKNGDYYIAGNTTSTDLPVTPGVHQSKSGGKTDGFIAKFNNDGQLLWNTYLGGTETDAITSLDIDTEGNIYAGGYTNSRNLAANYTEQSLYMGAYDGFVAKFDKDGKLLWSTYIGSPAPDSISSLAFDTKNNRIVAAGVTSSSTDFIKVPLQKNSRGGREGFIKVLDTDGSLIWDRYWGGEGADEIHKVKVDTNGMIYGAGSTSSRQHISVAAVSGNTYSGGSSDGFVFRMNPSGQLIWSGYFGGYESDHIYDMDIEGGKMYITGTTYSRTRVATSDAYLSQMHANTGVHIHPYVDAFWAVIDEYGNKEYSTYWGGINIAEHGKSIAVNSRQEVFTSFHTTTTSIFHNCSEFALNYHRNNTLVPYSSGCRNTQMSVISKFFQDKSYYYLRPGKCAGVNMVYSILNIPDGSYDYSVGVRAALKNDTGTLTIQPDSSYTYKGKEYRGFDGTKHTLEDLKIPSHNGDSCNEERIQVRIEFGEIDGCGYGRFIESAIHIENSSAQIIRNSILKLNTIGENFRFSSEPYDIYKGLVFTLADASDPVYPQTENALLNKKSAELYLYEIPPGESFFKVQLSLDTGNQNLKAWLNNLPVYVSASGTVESKKTSDIIIQHLPGIKNFACPDSINAGQEITLTGMNTGNANRVEWKTGRQTLLNSGTVTNPSLQYTPAGEDLAIGYIDFSLMAKNQNLCETTEFCRVKIVNVRNDYGDAPLSYNLGKDTIPIAASVSLHEQIFLGKKPPVAKTKATPSENADADGEEEDGLILPQCDIIAVAGEKYQLKIQATNHSATDAYINIFIDWDKNGNFLAENESLKSVVKVPAQSGLKTYPATIAVPADYVSSGEYYMRIKLSTNSNQIRQSFGPSPNGEIEDYRIIERKSKEVFIRETICGGESLKFGKDILTQSGEYTQIFKSEDKCDSTVILHLTVHDIIDTTFLSGEICKGKFLEIGTEQFHASGIYQIRLMSHTGCDSIVQLTLIVIDAYEEKVAATICNEGSYEVAEQLFTQTGYYEIPLKTSSGDCDSLVRLDLTVQEPITGALSETICYGEHYNIGSNSFDVSGQFAVVLQAAGGCDSTVTLQLTVIRDERSTVKDTTVCSDKHALLSAPGGFTEYIWQDGLLSTDYNIKDTGWYWVNMTEGCRKQTDSIWVRIESCSCEAFFPTAFSPNDDGKNDRFRAIEQNVQQTHLVIYNKWGNLIFETNKQNYQWDGTYRGKAVPVDTYIYHYRGTCADGTEYAVSGHVTILR